MSEVEKRLQIKPESPPTESDARAQKEAMAFANKDYERTEATKTHFHRGGLVVFWSVLVGMLAVAAVWLLHLLTPEKMHFLSEAQQGELQSIIITAVSSSAATSAYRKWVGGGNAD